MSAPPVALTWQVARGRVDRVQQTWRSEGGRDALRRGKGLEAKPEATNTRTSLSEAGPGLPFSQGLARLSGWREVASPALPCSRAAQERGPPSASSERLLHPGRLAPSLRFNDVPRWLLCSLRGNGGLQSPSRPGLTGFISLEISIDEQDRGKRRSFWMFRGIL